MDVGKNSVLSSFSYLVFACSIGPLSLFLLLDNFNNAKADFSVAEKHLIGFEQSKKSHIHTKNSKPINYHNLSKRFDDAYFKYSRPFEGNIIELIIEYNMIDQLLF